MNAVAVERKRLQDQQFPQGIPRLWCPTLSHFQAAGKPAAARIRSHLQSIATYVQGILVPGSTGEGWEMNDADIRGLLEIVLDAAVKLDIRVLVGVLKTDVDQMLNCLESMTTIRQHPAVVGVTICPPRGAELSQQVILARLTEVLSQGWPTALYQLPQVTQNEMSPETVAALADKFPNFILFKDTSGADRVARSGIDLGSVFMVRGAEQGGYATWTHAAGGPYDGFLLSTANVFAKELHTILKLLDDGRSTAAEDLSSKLVKVVSQAFKLAQDFPSGNAFANANKLLDHCLAYGNKTSREAPPLLYSGAQLTKSLVASALSLLEEHSLLPAQGYLPSEHTD